MDRSASMIWRKGLWLLVPCWSLFACAGADSAILTPDASAYAWLEVGDEWWTYYTGWDGPHGRRENEERGRWRQGGIGLVKIRKEGFVSLRGPQHGGVVVTRKLLWPGGELRLNADAHSGELKVRVSDASRQVLPGLDYSDCVSFTGDSVSHQMRWKDRRLSSLAGQVIRLEIYLQNANLYIFRAEGSD